MLYTGDIIRKELGAKGVLNLYYLSCKHKLQLKNNTNTILCEHNNHNANDKTALVTSQKCPISLLDYLGMCTILIMHLCAIHIIMYIIPHCSFVYAYH